MSPPLRLQSKQGDKSVNKQSTSAPTIQY